VPHPPADVEIFARRLAEDRERHVTSREPETGRARGCYCLHSCGTLARVRSIFPFVCIFYAVLLVNLRAQESATRNVVVTGENEEDQFTELGEYAQPAWAERSRMASTTSVYVLSPYEAFVGNVWEGDFDRHGKTTHDITQEIDFGLPHRFEIGIENEFGVIEDQAHETSATFEARYAVANWNAIPLNPTISLEYILGFGTSARTSSRQSDAFTARLLLGQNFGDHFGYGLNLSLQPSVSHGDEREFEVAQAIAYGAFEGKLELGAESRYTHTTQHGSHEEQNEFVIGPSIGWKPIRQLRVGVAELFGCTGDSPGVASFVLISYEFGGGEAIVSPVPHD